MTHTIKLDVWVYYDEEFNFHSEDELSNLMAERWADVVAGSAEFRDWHEQMGMPIQQTADKQSYSISRIHGVSRARVLAHGKLCYTFDEPKDAMLFKLTFGGV